MCVEFKSNFIGFQTWWSENTPYTIFGRILPEEHEHLFQRLCDTFKDHPEWPPWLIKHGFIEEVKEEVLYKRGDRFKREMDGVIGRIVQVGEYRVAFIEESSSNRWYENTISVENALKITSNEFKRMTNYTDDKFTLIPPKPKLEELYCPYCGYAKRGECENKSCPTLTHES